LFMKRAGKLGKQKVESRKQKEKENYENKK
jgi:hypothetical protein